jgi:hypothetical protein
LGAARFGVRSPDGIYDIPHVNADMFRSSLLL